MGAKVRQPAPDSRERVNYGRMSGQDDRTVRGPVMDNPIFEKKSVEKKDSGDRSLPAAYLRPSPPPPPKK